jgi:AraC family transcriptional regulator
MGGSATARGVGAKTKNLDLDGEDIFIDALRRPLLSVRRTRYDGAVTEAPPAAPKGDGYVVNVTLRSPAAFVMWHGEKHITSKPTREGSICVSHLEDELHVELEGPFDIVRFDLPTATLRKNFEDSRQRNNELIRVFPGTLDPVVTHLARSIAPALESAGKGSSLFLDMIGLALSAHLMHAYGTTPISSPALSGGLAPWQERRAKEMIAANLDGDLSVVEMARECGLSTSHFTRAFKRSTSVTPYQWLIQQRLHAAKKLMLSTDLSLLEIAAVTGFADQAHLARRFAQSFGASPGVWRRYHSRKEGVLSAIPMDGGWGR